MHGNGNLIKRGRGLFQHGRLLRLFGLLVAAVCSLLVPINMPTSDGVFGCGSALQPPTESFTVGVCQDVPESQQLRAGGLAIGAAVLTVLGYAFFGRELDAHPAVD